MFTVAWLAIAWLASIVFVWSWLVAAARADRRAARRPPPPALPAPPAPPVSTRVERRERDRVHH